MAGPICACALSDDTFQFAGGYRPHVGTVQANAEHTMLTADYMRQYLPQEPGVEPPTTCCAVLTWSQALAATMRGTINTSKHEGQPRTHAMLQLYLKSAHFSMSTPRFWPGIFEASQQYIVDIYPHVSTAGTALHGCLRQLWPFSTALIV